VIDLDSTIPACPPPYRLDIGLRDLHAVAGHRVVDVQPSASRPYFGHRPQLDGLAESLADALLECSVARDEIA
jgi:hypothetical protein